MNRLTGTGIIALALLLSVSFSGFAQTPPDLGDIQRGVADFSKNLAISLPLNASLGMNWADAYIGKLFPSLPPHFGVGVSFGVSSMEMSVMKELADNLGSKLPFNSKKMILPAYTGEARIGGFFIPFDFGVKFGYLPPIKIWGTDMDANFMLIGADIRYAILDGKSKPVVPNISLGVGFNYLKGSVGGKAGASKDIAFDIYNIHLTQPEVNLEWKTMVLDVKLQLSKTILILTPYIGAGMSYAKSSSGYSVDAIVSGDVSRIKGYLSQNGLADMDVDTSGISSIVTDKAFNFRVYGGLALNMVAFKLDLTGLYSIRDNNFGASVGFRFQL